MSDQATAGSETEESAQVPSDHQGTQYDDKTLVKQLLEACSNNKEEYRGGNVTVVMKITTPPFFYKITLPFFY